MEKKNKKTLVWGASLLAIFVLWTMLVCLVDVQAVGPEGSSVGFATLNSYVHNLTGVNFSLYVITDWLGLVPIGVALGFAILGLVQWIKRKSLFKVDKGIVVLGVFVIALATFWYVFDEILVVNYRPILVDGEVEASYPSTHILLVTFTLLSAPSVLYDYFKNRKVIIVLSLCSSLLIAITFVLRLASGMHWFTDCVGGMILGLAMYCLYIGCKQAKVKKEEL
jgi:undecaprenyl-diphosphatase